jgi:prevent-host-death family protein
MACREAIMDQIVNIHEAKTRLSSLIVKVCKGESVVIAKAGKPLVKMIPIVADERPRTPGRLKGRIRMAPDFCRTSQEIIDAFEGN